MPAVKGDLKRGDRVEIFGLSSLQEYNGTFGTVKEWVEEKQRWSVTCDYDGKGNKLNSKNIKRVEA